MTTTALPAAPHQVPPRRRRTMAVVAGVGVAALVAAMIGILSNSGSDEPSRDLFRDSGAGFNADPRPVSRAQLTLALPTAKSVAGDQGGVLTFHAVRTFVATNTARSSVTYWICSGAGATEFGSGDPARFCPSLVPIVDGTRLAYASPGRYVVAVITPTRPGRTSLVRADLTYSVDGTEVTEPVRLDATLRATALRSR